MRILRISIESRSNDRSVKDTADMEGVKSLNCSSCHLTLFVLHVPVLC